MLCFTGNVVVLSQAPSFSAAQVAASTKFSIVSFRLSTPKQFNYNRIPNLNNSPCAGKSISSSFTFLLRPFLATLSMSTYPSANYYTRSTLQTQQPYLKVQLIPSQKAIKYRKVLFLISSVLAIIVLSFSIFLQSNISNEYIANMMDMNHHMMSSSHGNPSFLLPIAFSCLVLLANFAMMLIYFGAVVLFYKAVFY